MYEKNTAIIFETSIYKNIYIHKTKLNVNNTFQYGNSNTQLTSGTLRNGKQQEATNRSMSVRVGEDQQVGGRQVQAAAGLERQERSAAN